MNRRLRLGLLTIAAGLAGMALVVLMLRALSQPQLRYRWDFAGTSPLALSQRSAAALAAMPEGSRATLFLDRPSPQDPLTFYGSAVYPNAYAVLRVAAEEIRIQSHGKVEVQVLDEFTAPVKVAAEKARLGHQYGQMVYLEAGEKRRILRFAELFRIVQPVNEQPARLHSHRVDEALGDAALRLGRGHLPRIAVYSGLLPFPREDLGPFLQLLASEGYQAAAVESLPGPGDDWDLLIIPGQRGPLLAADAEAARAWVEQDRPLFLALGSFTPAPAMEFWNQQLAPRGAAFLEGRVCKKFRGATGLTANADHIAVTFEGMQANHAITADLHLDQRWLELGSAQALDLTEGSVDYARETILWLDGSAWIEPDELQPTFQPSSRTPRGPFNMVVATSRWDEQDGGRGRALLSGSATYFVDPQRALARDFLSSATRWLLGEDQASSGLVALQSLPFRPTAAQHARLANLSILALPGATLLFGLLVFWRRRR